MAEQTQNKPSKAWRLESIKVEYQKYGDKKGKYVGTIKFENEESESFVFNIKPDMAEKYLKVLSGDLVRNVCDLTRDLVYTLPIDKNNG